MGILMNSAGFEELPQRIKDLPEQSRQCPHCHREIVRTWLFCPSCGMRTNDAVVRHLSMTDTENASHLLNGLINYHERVVGFRPDPTGDSYICALRYALMCVESFFEDENGDTVQNDYLPINLA